jgi:hypothetical protein
MKPNSRLTKLRNSEDKLKRRTEMQAPIDPNDTTVKHFIYYYAWFWAATSVLYFFCVTFILLPEGGRDFANIILGFLLGTAVATIISFFYGSSKSSKDKTDALMKVDDVKPL